MAPSNTSRIGVKSLRLDSQNPRLPENLQGSGQTELLDYLYNNATLDELIMSFVDNGYFGHEPLIVSRPDSAGIHDVLEGNRRLAALTILLRLDTATTLGVESSVFPKPTKEELRALHNVPCVVVGDREEIHRFLGFRHIGGIKTWSAEAKARYLLEEVHRTHEQYPEREVFKVVGRRVGSNAQGVRNAYIAMKILVFGRDEFGIDISTIQLYRFGVWNRAMNSPDLRAYIGFGNSRSYDEVEASLKLLREQQLREVLRDISPVEGSSRPVLGDSRDVTIYAQVLQNDRARQVLRDYGQLKLARQVIEQASMPQRIRQIGRSIEILIQEVGREGAPSDSQGPAVELSNLAGSLRDLISARVPT